LKVRDNCCREKPGTAFVIDYLPRETAALPVSWGELLIIFSA